MNPFDWVLGDKPYNELTDAELKSLADAYQDFDQPDLHRATVYMMALRAEIKRCDRLHEQTIGERDAREDQLEAIYRALGGEGEWCGKLAPAYPPNSGDLGLDAVALAEEFRTSLEAEARAYSEASYEWKVRAEKAEAALAAERWRLHTWERAIDSHMVVNWVGLYDSEQSVDATFKLCIEKALDVERDTLRAENERLRAEFAGFPNLTAMRMCMVDTADENKRLREAATPLVNFAWSAVTADCKEARDYLNKLVAALRNALAPR